MFINFAQLWVFGNKNPFSITLLFFLKVQNEIRPEANIKSESLKALKLFTGTDQSKN